MLRDCRSAVVIAAHPDDEILGCGATMKRLTAAGCRVHVLILGEGFNARMPKASGTGAQTELKILQKNCLEANQSLGVEGVAFCKLPDNRFDSVDLLDIVKEIEVFLRAHPSDVVFTHHDGDLNIDHQITHRAVITATRPCAPGTPGAVVCFNVLSSTEWYFGHRDNRFCPNLFVNVGPTIEDKLRAMSFYTSEIKPFPFARSLESIRIQARHYGQMAHTEFAEAFEIGRYLIDDL